jgi:hypothetical protein
MRPERLGRPIVARAQLLAGERAIDQETATLLSLAVAGAVRAAPRGREHARVARWRQEDDGGLRGTKEGRGRADDRARQLVRRGTAQKLVCRME